MKLHQLRVLLALAQHGSMHEASRSMHVSQPALSKAVAELERELGVTLISRSVRGVSLTNYGRALVKRASVVEHELRHALEDIESMRGHAEAQLNIGFSAVASSGPLPEAIAAFRMRFPSVAIRAYELRPQQILEGLREGHLDVALISTNSGPGTSAFQWEPLFSVGMIVAARPGHPLGGVTRVRALAEAQWLTLDPLDDPGSPLASLMRLHRLEMPRDVVQSSSNLLGLQLATRTDLISVWSDFVFYGDVGPLALNPNALKPLPIREELPDYDVYMVYRSTDLMTQTCLEFSKEIRHRGRQMISPREAARSPQTAPTTATRGRKPSTRTAGAPE
ncbi:LysR family transcriptional regulator [Paraburkholderia eburnea]|uniref:LysR family transcriptional regulator n=1 Tax=Paraburkholderia eburnea TaxID=1189126 RepID=A0A2S4LYM2_9BURK|nr:LysR substrate-binding domain-containing protein [Paraburkholderia eburnea]POR47449.1 LysR family transcriptional regulator [Paraburkholderia eburnea]PRZ19037.1 LysR family transcriptional regulator [Paraburkholderia eburnea]